MVGGPPTIDLFAAGMKLGLKGLGKMGKKFRNFTRKFTHTVHAYIESLGLNPKLTKILKKTACTVLGEPVDVATGRVYHTNTDFELPGPIPIVWERTYYSDAAVDGPLGHNWHHSYNLGIHPLGDEAFLFRHADGRESALPALGEGESHFDREEQLTWTRDAEGYLLEDADGMLYRFNGPENRQGYRMVSSVSTRDGFVVRFTYGATGSLKEIATSRNETLRVDTDDKGRVTAVTLVTDEEETLLVGYRYDGHGDMVQTTDARGVSKHFEYGKGHLLTRLTNQGGMAFHWEYEGEGENARCVHTWGDGGVMEYFFEYAQGVTRTRNGEGADIRHAYDRDGYLQSTQAGEGWKASWMRDSAGLEMQRTCSGGITVRTERDRFGRETRKSVRSGSIERGAWRYEWGMADRLLSKENELTGTVMRYDYDRFDFLIRQETTKGSATDVIYRVPDFVGNLYGTPERKDRRYDAGGRLLEDAECIYHYNDEGNLIFREFRQPREDAVRHDRRQMEREYGIRRPVTDMGWIYEWTSGGMLRRVIRPDGKPVEFRYDALRRRTAKRYLGKVTRWVWDGNTPLHEWVAAATDNDGEEEASCPDGNSLTTWVFEEGTFVPAAKIRGDRQCSIVSDYLGTPVQMYDSEGNKIWDCTLDIYGKVLAVDKGTEFDCPFRFQEQYEDIETWLYYNRFKYYDSDMWVYVLLSIIKINGLPYKIISYVYELLLLSVIKQKYVLIK